MSPDKLQDLTAVITGARRGLGAALAEVLAGHGCRPILCGRSAAALDAVAAGIRDRTGRFCDTVMLDLADSTSVEVACRRIIADHPRIDLLINNGAAWLEHRDAPYTAAEVTGAIHSALTGTFLFTQGLLPALQRSPRPDVVTIGSISGLPNAALQTVAIPFYAAKHGQTALADGLRQWLAGTPVRSICIHPPYLEDISPADATWPAVPERSKGERATNRDVVEAVLFAVTRPRHVTIASLVIDSDRGGLHAG